jgi:hypothetical protein
MNFRVSIDDVERAAWEMPSEYQGKARDALVAAIDRECKRWRNADNVSWNHAIQVAEGWDGATEIEITVYRWDAPHRGSAALRFKAWPEKITSVGR